jgi:transcriptional antiterminator RfaH
MKQWYVLRSKTKQEKLAANVLATASIETYLPATPVPNRRGKPVSFEPLFPGYLFGHLDSDQSEVRLVSYTPGVVAVLGYGNQPTPVPDNLIYSIRERLTRQPSNPSNEEYRKGDRLLIAGGPLRGIEAVFDRQLSGSGRVRVLIQVLSQVWPAEVRAEHLRHVSKEADIRQT